MGTLSRGAVPFPILTVRSAFPFTAHHPGIRGLVHHRFGCHGPHRSHQRRRWFAGSGNPHHPPATRTYDAMPVMIPRHAEHEPAIRTNKSAPAAGTLHRFRHGGTLNPITPVLQAPAACGNKNFDRSDESKPSKMLSCLMPSLIPPHFAAYSPTFIQCSPS